MGDLREGTDQWGTHIILNEVHLCGTGLQDYHSTSTSFFGFISLFVNLAFVLHNPLSLLWLPGNVIGVCCTKGSFT